MELTDIERILKALVFSSSDPLSIKDIQSTFSQFHSLFSSPSQDEDSPPPPFSHVPSLITASQIRQAFHNINLSLLSSNDVYTIHSSPNGYKLVIIPEFADWVRALRNESKPIKLRPSALETLSIIAYKQPVSRSEIETIRGVSSDSNIQKLTELDLITAVGRAELPGRPIQYGTTSKFLELCGIQSLDQLPSTDALSQSLLNQWIAQSSPPIPPSPTSHPQPLTQSSLIF